MNFLTKALAGLKSGLQALSPTCRDASRLQSEALDGPLPASKRIGLALHLVICKWCRRYGRQITFIHRAAHEHPDKCIEVAGKPLSTEARERIKERLRTEK